MFSFFSLNINVKIYAIPSKPRLLNDEVIDFEKLLIIQITVDNLEYLLSSEHI